MNRFRNLLLPVVLLQAVELWGANDRSVHRNAQGSQRFAQTVSVFTASPSTISFTSSDPGAEVTAAGSVLARILQPALNERWQLKIHASASTLTHCTSVPVSAITVSCGSVDAQGGLLFHPTGSCAASVPLSVTPTVIASGKQGDGGIVLNLSPDVYSVNLSFKLTDSWAYRGANSPACSVDLTYTLSLDY